MGSKYLCLDCGETYDSTYLKINDYDNSAYCPKTSCTGELIEVDELILPTIKILNMKGYLTKYCCSGHWSDQHPQGYIMFQDGIDIPYLPNGFSKELNGDNVTIRSNMPLRKPTISDFKRICDRAKVLVNWANKLPCFEG